MAEIRALSIMMYNVSKEESVVDPLGGCPVFFQGCIVADFVVETDGAYAPEVDTVWSLPRGPLG